MLFTSAAIVGRPYLSSIHPNYLSENLVTWLCNHRTGLIAVDTHSNLLIINNSRYESPNCIQSIIESLSPIRYCLPLHIRPQTLLESLNSPTKYMANRYRCIESWYNTYIYRHWKLKIIVTFSDPQQVVPSQINNRDLDIRLAVSIFYLKYLNTPHEWQKGKLVKWSRFITTKYEQCATSFIWPYWIFKVKIL